MMDPTTRLFAASAALLSLACDRGVPEIEPAPVEQVSCPEGEQRVGARCVSTLDVEGLPIGFNFVGFHPDRIKRVTAREPHARFTIRREDGSPALEGRFEGPVPDTHAGGEAWVADFTELTEPGEYTFETDGLNDEQIAHARIHIAPDVFDDALRVAMMGLTGQRCGQAVSLELDGETYSHGKCHLDDASLDHIDDGEGMRNGAGGWHDAGDYGKYTVNGAFAAGMMLVAWEHFPERLEAVAFQVPEQDNDIPDFLDEVKWQLEWLLRMQREDGAAYHKITPYGQNAWPGDVLPADDAAQRYYASVSSTGTADLVAVAAMAARIYEDYDSAFADRCREAAEAGYAFLTDHPEAIDPKDDAWLQRHYNSPDDDERLWAAAEMWESFGWAEALADLESRAANATISTNWDWPAVQNLGLFTYLLSSREDRDVRDPDVLAHVETELGNTADRIVSTAESHAYGVGYSGRPYWGINGVILRMAMTLHVAHQLSDDTSFLDAAIQQLDHVLGRNLYGRSFVTALGVAPPMWPHHRPSVADRNRAPWPGLLVGGPNGEGPDERTDEDNDWRAWEDSSSSYVTNEVAINWNAALVYALAATYDG